MAVVYATLVEEVRPSTAVVKNPGIFPTWASQDEHCLSTIELPHGYITTWSCEGALIVQRALPSRPVAVALARFPDLDSEDQTRHACLSIACQDTIVVTAPSGYCVEYPLPVARFHGTAATALFPVRVGLVVEFSKQSRNLYYFMNDPQDEMTLLELPESHCIVYASTDVPILVSTTEGCTCVWEAEFVCESLAASLHTGTGVSQDARISTSPLARMPETRPRRMIMSLRRVFDMKTEGPVTAFLSHDLRGLLVICIVSSGILTGLSFCSRDLHVTNVKACFKVRDVVSAVPIVHIRGLRGCLDILIRTTCGSMFVYAGRNRLCTVAVENEPPSFRLCDGVGPRFSMRGTGTSAKRYSLEGTFFSSPLVDACLGAVNYCFALSDSSKRVTSFYQELLKARAHALTRMTPGSQWDQFERCMMVAIGAGCGYEDTMQVEKQNPEPHPALVSWQGLSRRFLSTPQGLTERRSFPFTSKNSSAACGGSGERPAGLSTETLNVVLQALHLLYEDHKLDFQRRGTAWRLAKLNIQIAAHAGASAYLDHYLRDFPCLSDSFNQSTTHSRGKDDLVHSITDHLAERLRKTGQPMRPYAADLSHGRNQAQDKALLASWLCNGPCQLTCRVWNYFECLYGPASRHQSVQRIGENLLSCMVNDRFTRFELDALPFGVALPLKDWLYTLKLTPPSSANFSALVLLGREDIFKHLENQMEAFELHESQCVLSESLALLALKSAVSSQPEASEEDRRRKRRAASNRPGCTARPSPYIKGCDDGCEMEALIHQQRFGADQRLREVRRILRSTDEVIMSPVFPIPGENTADIDLAGEQRQKLEILLRKRLAVPVGRGAFTLRTSSPSDPTQPLHIPEICITGKLYGHRGAKVGTANADSPLFQWGYFHNGVAAGLRLVGSECDRFSEASQILTRSWIVNHRPEDIPGSPGHAGMLFGIGLGGYLPSLTKTDFYQYLLPRHELTSIGLMLGLSACIIGSKDERLTKMLCLHIRHFNTTGFEVPEFQVSSNVQTAAIVGLGFLYYGSCERPILEGLLDELARKPKPGLAIDNRESLALAAGFSVGLVCMGSGSCAFDKSESNIAERLLVYVNGGLSQTGVKGRQDTPFGSPKDETHSVTSQSASSAAAESEASRIREGPLTSIDVVSPGAILALAMMYMKTNDRRLVDRILFPDTFYALNRTKPLHVYLKILARSLIMWDEIMPSESWVVSAMPPLLRSVTREGVCDPFDVLGRVRLHDVNHEHDVDLSGLLQARAFALAATCTSIALKYTGSGCRKAIAILRRGCRAFENGLLEQDGETAMEWVLMSSMCSAALALSVAAAGSGDLEIFRFLRRLRRRSAPSLMKSRYGFHLAIHLAIGFLFLGGGCQTFGTSNVGIAGLLLTLYPQFPRDVSDNQYHLQALRHMYVLAAEPRCIETRDLETGESCCVDMTLRRSDGRIIATKTPCIVPEADNISQIMIESERYMSRTVTINPPLASKGWFSAIRSQVVLVKRRLGHLPFDMDPLGSKGIISRDLNCASGSVGDYGVRKDRTEDLVNAFRADPQILSFARYYCDSLTCKGISGSPVIRTLNRYEDMLHECLDADKAEAVQIHLDCRRTATSMAQGHCDPQSLANVRLLNEYGGMPISHAFLVDPAYLSRVLKLSKEFLSREAMSTLHLYVKNKEFHWPAGTEMKRDFAAALCLSGVACGPGVLDTLLPLPAAAQQHISSEVRVPAPLDSLNDIALEMWLRTCETSPEEP